MPGDIVYFKNITLDSLLFFSKTIILGIYLVRNEKSKQLIWENGTLKNEASDIAILYLYGRFFGSRINK